MFLNNDKNLLNLDFLIVADTRLKVENKSHDLEEALSNWKLIDRFDSDDGMSHMGLIMLQSHKSKHEDILRNIKQK